MEQREVELNNITHTYDTNDSIKWLNSGGVPKLKIHDDEQIKLEIGEKTIQAMQKSRTNGANGDKNGKPKKKVKFKSDISNFSENMESNTMNEYFSLMNDEMNKDIRERESEINLKMNVIKEVERRDKLDEEKESKNVNLNNFFESMKVKTKDSDVYAAKTQTDVINISKRIDKLETYLFDIINNQLKILEKLENLKSKDTVKDTIKDTVKDDEFNNESFSAI